MWQQSWQTDTGLQLKEEQPSGTLSPAKELYSVITQSFNIGAIYCEHTVTAGIVKKKPTVFSLF